MSSMRRMRCVVASVLMLLAVPVGATPLVVTAERVPSGLWQPQTGETPLFLGVSGRLRDRDSEIAAAIQRAAAEAARHVQVEAAYRRVTVSTGRTVGQHEVYDVEWDRGREAGLLEHMEPVRIIRHDRGTVVWARVAGLRVAPGLPHGVARSGTGVPGWVSAPPEAPPGYEVAVGVASRLREFTALVDAADASALAGIIESGRVQVEVLQSARAERRTEQQSMVSRTSSRGTVQGFTVLMRYWDENRRVLYSLAIGEVIGVR